MKIELSCMECFKELGHPSVEFVFANYNDDLTITIKCSKGHVSNNVLQSTKFELFLACGAEALINEYLLEACVNFSIARENLFIFALDVMLNNLSTDYFKTIKHQSERITGAFGALYFHHFNKIYDFDKKNRMKDGLQKFRNRIIHKGSIPNIEEATLYGKTVYDEIVTLVGELKEKFSTQIKKHIFNLLHTRHEKKDYEACSTMSLNYMFSLEDECSPKSFEEALENFKKHVTAMTGVNIRLTSYFSIKINGLKVCLNHNSLSINDFRWG